MNGIVDSDKASVFWGKLDYGEGPDHLRHMVRAAHLSEGNPLLGLGVAIAGVGKEGCDVIANTVKWLFGGSTDWDSLSDLNASSKGIIWGGALQRDPNTKPSEIINTPEPEPERPWKPAWL